MPSTGNFDIVAEVTQAKLNELLLAAYQSSKIPHSVNVPAGTMFGQYQLTDGVVQISSTGLALAMAPPSNGVQITLPSQIDVQIANPPVPSLSTFHITANILVTLPLGQMPDPTPKVGFITDGLPRGNVTVNLTSGNPVPAVTSAMINDYVNQQFLAGPYASPITEPNVSFGAFTGDAYFEAFDSTTDPTKAITVTQNVGSVTINIPTHLRISNLKPEGASPFGVGATLVLNVPVQSTPTALSATFSTGTASVANLVPWPGSEGANYTIDKVAAAGFGIDLAALLTTQLQQKAQAVLQSMPDVTFQIPTDSDIENFIGDQVYQQLLTTGNIGVWTPNPPAGSPITVQNVTPRALASSAAIGLNSEAGADPSAWTEFIPSNRDFAIAVNASVVLQTIQTTIHRPESQGGFGPSFPPKTFHNIDGHDAKLTSLDITLQEGSIHMTGDVTVINAILGSIDVDASFSADAGLTWQNNADGTQMIQPVTLDTNVDLSLLAWIVSFLLGFITLGLVGGIIALVVIAVVQGVASNIGSQIVQDDVTKQITGIGAWPQTLDQIGTVQASFSNPIDIHTDSVVMSG